MFESVYLQAGLIAFLAALGLIVFVRYPFLKRYIPMLQWLAKTIRISLDHWNARKVYQSSAQVVERYTILLELYSFSQSSTISRQWFLKFILDTRARVFEATGDEEEATIMTDVATTSHIPPPVPALALTPTPIIPFRGVNGQPVTVYSNGNPSCNLPDHRVSAGCTAVLAVVKDQRLYVANAGQHTAVLFYSLIFYYLLFSYFFFSLVLFFSLLFCSILGLPLLCCVLYSSVLFNFIFCSAE